MTTGLLRLFNLGAGALGLRVCRELGMPANAYEESSFADGERTARPLDDVDGCDVYVLHSLHADPLDSVHDKLCRLLFFIGALKDAGAGRVSAVVPYLAYARKDRQSAPRDPVATRYVASLFESAGVDLVMVVDVHNLAAFQNAFRCRTAHVEAGPLLTACLAPLAQAGEMTVMAPDAGAIARAARFREALAAVLGRPVAAGFAEKHRDGRQLSGSMIAGDIADRHVVIVDDMIATGATVARTAQACRRMGARSVQAVATHGLFTAGAQQALSGVLDRLVVTDTVPPFRLGPGPLRETLRVQSVAPLLAEAIRRAHGALQDGGR